MRVLIGLLFGVALTSALANLAAGAHAADAPLVAQADGWSGQPRQPPPPPPPAPGFAPYGAPYGYAPPPPAMMYESQKKNEMLALVFEFLVPGVGSIYADHLPGAIFTWVTMVASVGLIIWWFDQNVNSARNDGTGFDNGFHEMWAFWAAIAVGLGGRVYGFIDAYSSATDYNSRLRARLGMPDWAVSVVPVRTDRAVTLAPSLTFRF